MRGGYSGARTQQIYYFVYQTRNLLQFPRSSLTGYFSYWLIIQSILNVFISVALVFLPTDVIRFPWNDTVICIIGHNLSWEIVRETWLSILDHSFVRFVAVLS